MSLYLPFIPKHLISTYLPYQHTYTLIQKTNKHTIPISIYILYYSITISLHHHSIHTHLYSIHLLSYLAIPILSHYLTHSSINHYSTIFYSHLHYHHSTTTQIYHSIPSKIRRRRYIFFQLFIIIISIIILENTILYYFTYSPSYTILIYTLTPTIYIIYLPFHHHQYIEYLSTQTYTHTHTQTYTHTHTHT